MNSLIFFTLPVYRTLTKVVTLCTSRMGCACSGQEKDYRFSKGTDRNQALHSSNHIVGTPVLTSNIIYLLKCVVLNCVFCHQERTGNTYLNNGKFSHLFLKVK